MNVLSFGFTGIEEDKELRKAVNFRIAQILAQAPPGSYTVGGVELLGLTHFARVRIHSPFRDFAGQAASMTARGALMRALDRLEDEVSRWRWGSYPVMQPEETSLPNENLEYY